MITEEYDFFISELMQKAEEAYSKTDTAGFAKEKLRKMDLDCEIQLAKSQIGFVEDCFSLITETNGYREEFIYRKGMSDCVSILKTLGVLA